MKLYFSPGACSLSPHIALLESGLPFSIEQVDLRAKTLKSGGDYLAVNPKGQVPALITDSGDLLTEGPAIVQYIADQAPASGLAPANGTMERYRLQEWLNFVSTELHKTFSPLFRPTTPEAYKEIAREALRARYATLDARFSRASFLMGDRFTVADGYLYVTLRWAKSLGLDLSGLDHLAAYKARVEQRPHVQEALKAEGLS